MDIGLSLLISPIVWFGGVALLLYLLKRTIKGDELFHIPEVDEDTPPLPVRILLVCTCTLVSFFHGSNDGQKGFGFMMLVLIVFLPAKFAVNSQVSGKEVIKQLNSMQQTLQQLPETTSNQKKVVTQAGSSDR